MRKRPGKLLFRVAALCMGIAVMTDLSGSAAAARKHSSSGRVQGRIGDLTVLNAFLPQPPSTSVAAIYLTVRNSGSRPDALVAVSSPDADSSMLMTENRNGTMGILDRLSIPAHGQASLVPGRDHLMLEQPQTTLKLGGHVNVTLRFLRSGSLTIVVPVVPLNRILSGRG
jgi:periplasmic copper chaperone A